MARSNSSASPSIASFSLLASTTTSTTESEHVMMLSAMPLSASLQRCQCFWSANSSRMNASTFDPISSTRSRHAGSSCIGRHARSRTCTATLNAVSHRCRNSSSSLPSRSHASAPSSCFLNCATRVLTSSASVFRPSRRYGIHAWSSSSPSVSGCLDVSRRASLKACRASTASSSMLSTSRLYRSWEVSGLHVDATLQAGSIRLGTSDHTCSSAWWELLHGSPPPPGWPGTCMMAACTSFAPCSAPSTTSYAPSDM
mmetsp:Transcript_41551/g.106300  ORF Transcript_41551/g.106300 Transcript_41551/m.106300 type:complete len:256 (-) Transcript_41551:291-1058(-)